jgi:hypothetical protein
MLILTPLTLNQELYLQTLCTERRHGRSFSTFGGAFRASAIAPIWHFRRADGSHCRCFHWYWACCASVIITSRVASRGEVAKRYIKEAVGPSYKGDISCLDLDLESYESCTSFMARLKTSLADPAALDVAILNGGMINSHWEQSEAGW